MPSCCHAPSHGRRWILDDVDIPPRHVESPHRLKHQLSWVDSVYRKRRKKKKMLLSLVCSIPRSSSAKRPGARIFKISHRTLCILEMVERFPRRIVHLVASPLDQGIRSDVHVCVCPRTSYS